MKFNFHFGRSPELSPQPTLSPDMQHAEEAPVRVEGAEYPNELNLKSLAPGDKVFVRAEGGSQYMFENQVDEPGKIAMYKKSTDPNAGALWGVAKYLYQEGAVEVKKNEKFVYMTTGNGALVPSQTDRILDIELHRNTQVQ